ncbi:glycoside hydrolase family 19 protein, partial [Atopomonas sediminilitoris]|uniref:glycoside hydrolase family 19 protein n=1 Tax=Atopomonas sediminilitoris TaxID=2919919 RepID=UPI002795B45B
QYQALIDQSDKGPVKQRLYDVIDTNQDSHLTSDEIRAAHSKPWQAQALGQLITRHESEWFWNQTKWDELDVLMEHTPVDPNAVWVEEKKRIQKLCWWEGVAEKVGLNGSGRAWHLQSTALIAKYQQSSCNCELSVEKFKSVFGDRRIFSAYNMPKDGDAFNGSIGRFVDLINSAFKSYGFASCLHKAHFLAQCYHESDHFNTMVEYADGLDYDLATHPATVCSAYGVNSRACRRHRQIMAEGNTVVGDGPKYKGRGLIQITWKSAYKAFSDYSGVDCVGDPDAVARNMELAISASLWFWTVFKGESLNKKIDRYYQELSSQSGLSEAQKDDEVVRRVTKIVNGGRRGLEARQQLFRVIKGNVR